MGVSSPPVPALVPLPAAAAAAVAAAAATWPVAAAAVAAAANKQTNKHCQQLIFLKEILSKHINI